MISSVEHEHRLAADPVAEVAEDDAAERAGERSRRRTCRTRASVPAERIERREEQLVEDERGGGAVEEEVVPLDGGADEAGQGDLARTTAVSPWRSSAEALLPALAMRLSPPAGSSTAAKSGCRTGDRAAEVGCATTCECAAVRLPAPFGRKNVRLRNWHTRQPWLRDGDRNAAGRVRYARPALGLDRGAEERARAKARSKADQLCPRASSFSRRSKEPGGRRGCRSCARAWPRGCRGRPGCRGRASRGG